jgi:hypothetical protein
MGTATFGEVGNQTNLTSTGQVNMFVAKYGTDGTLAWVKQAGAGGTSGNYGFGIAVDVNGNSYVTGVLTGTATFDGTNLTTTGSSDVFVAKYGTDGTLAWAKKAGGDAGAINGSSRGIAIDGSGNSYVTGYFNDTTTFGGTNLNSRGGSDIFVAKYDSAGTLAWAKQEGGANNDYGDGIAVDGTGNIYVTGDFSGSATFGGTTLTSTSSSDVFVAKYISGGGETPIGTDVNVIPVDPNPVVPGTSVGVTFAEVTQPGTTTVTSTDSGTPPPTGFSLGDPPVYFDIATTAILPPGSLITVCISYPELMYGDENKLRLYHQHGGVWEDVTTSLDTTNNIICGASSSLSAFAILEATYQFVGFFKPVQTGPDVVNLAYAGKAIPLKWKLLDKQGGFITDLSAVTGIRNQQTACSESALFNDINEALSSGSSGLHYDFSSNQYVYSWKTAKNMAGKCYRLNVELFHKDVHSADFHMW